MGHAEQRGKRALEKVRGWSWDPFEDRFLRDLRLLQRFASREGQFIAANTLTPLRSSIPRVRYMRASCRIQTFSPIHGASSSFRYAALRMLGCTTSTTIAATLIRVAGSGTTT